VPKMVLGVQRNRHVLSKIWTVPAQVDVQHTPVEHYEKLACALGFCTGRLRAVRRR
jgi:hypothetical protein